MRGRTIILVSHHVQLCAPGASYVVALENGRLLYKGDRQDFQSSGVMHSLAHSGAVESIGKDEDETVVRETKEEVHVGEKDDEGGSSTPSTEIPSEDDSLGGVTSIDENSANKKKKKGPRKLVEEETRAVGRVDRSVWKTYFKACGGASFWLIFAVSFLLAAVSPIAENGWLRYARRSNSGAGILRAVCSHWSGSSLNSREPRSPMYYIGVYAAVSINQFFEGPNLILSSRTKVTGVGSFPCYGFCKIVS
jgi:hypothetical protein